CISSRRHDPGDLRQCAVFHVVSEVVEKVFRPGPPLRIRRGRGRENVNDTGTRTALLEERRGCRGCGVLITVENGIVGEVTRERIACPVPEIRREGFPGKVLINLPAHSGRLQYFRKRGEGPIRLVLAETVEGGRPGTVAVGAPGPQVAQVADAARPHII